MENHKTILGSACCRLPNPRHPTANSGSHRGASLVMRRKRLLVAAVAVIVLGFLFGTAGARESLDGNERAAPLELTNALRAASGDDSEKSAETVYKNIRVFKGLPASKLEGAMDFMSASLGVGCAYCHTSAFEQDDKIAKQVSRTMIRMTLELNKASFGGSLEVTCYTCHRGQPAPVASPTVGAPVKPKASDASRTASGATLPTGDQLFDRYIKSLGGEAALAKITSRKIKGTMLTADGTAATFEAYQKTPNKLLTVAAFSSAVKYAGFNGTSAWARSDDKIDEVDGESHAVLKRDAEFYQGIAFKELYKNVMVAGEARVGSRAAFLLVATAPDGSPERFFFDAASGLLLRRVRVTKTALGELSTQTDFEDYRKVDGVRLPFTTRWSTAGMAWSRKIISVRNNVRIGDEKFEPLFKTVNLDRE